MRRGDVVLVSLPGGYGKPRPAVIVQADVINEADPGSWMVCPMTTTPTGWRYRRLAVDPDAGNGLTQRCEIMVDKVTAATPNKIGGTIGRLDEDTMRRLDGLLMVALGLAS